MSNKNRGVTHWRWFIGKLMRTGGRAVRAPARKANGSWRVSTRLRMRIGTLNLNAKRRTGRPRSCSKGERFMESFDSLMHAHWDVEPNAHRRTGRPRSCSYPLKLLGAEEPPTDSERPAD